MFLDVTVDEVHNHWTLHHHLAVNPSLIPAFVNINFNRTLAFLASYILQFNSGRKQLSARRKFCCRWRIGETGDCSSWWNDAGWKWWKDGMIANEHDKCPVYYIIYGLIVCAMSEQVVLFSHCGDIFMWNRKLLQKAHARVQFCQNENETFGRCLCANTNSLIPFLAE